MSKKILFSLLMVGLVAALAVGGTFAYFTASKTDSITVTTGRVSLGNPSPNPLTFGNMMPGETQAKALSVQNTSTVPVDLYVKWNGAGSTAAAYCNQMTVGVKNGSDTIAGPADACAYQNGWIKLYSSVGVNQTVSPSVELTLKASVSDPSFMGQTVGSGNFTIVATQVGIAPQN